MVSSILFKLIKLKNNCFICTMFPLILFFRINPVPATTQCPHKNPPSNLPIFKKSHSIRILQGIQFLIVSVETCWILKKLWNRKLRFVEYVDEFGTFGQNFGFIMFTILVCRITYKLITTNNGFLMICKEYNINIFGKGIYLRKLHLFMFDVLGGHFLIMIITLNNTFQMDVNFPLILRTLNTTIIITNMCASILSMLTFNEAYMTVARICHGRLRKTLKKRLRQQQHQNDENQILNEIKMCQRLHLATHLNSDLYVRECNRVILLTWQCFSLFIVSYTFLIIYVIQQHETVTSIATISICKCIGGLHLFYLMCYESHRMSSVNQSILSFIFQYPISELNQMESSQLESYISTLTVKNFTNRIFDMCTVNHGLIASFSGIVITYALVAIQLCDKWCSNIESQ